MLWKNSFFLPFELCGQGKNKRHGGDREREIGSKGRFSYRAKVASMTESLYANGTIRS